MTGRMPKMAPRSPEMKASPPNTQTVVKNDDSTPGATWRTPSMAAWVGLLPKRRWAAMFSASTMASSINSPTPISSPTMEIMFTVMPKAAITAKVPMNDTGRPMATQNEKRKEKNSHMVRNTRIRPWAPFSTSMVKRSRTMAEMSRVMSMVTVFGARARSAVTKSSKASRTLSVSSRRDLSTDR